MAIGMLPDDRAPKVGEYKGRIAAWAQADDGDDIGFVLSAGSAKTLALRLLAEVARQREDELPAFDADSIALDERIEESGKKCVRMVITVKGAPIAVVLSVDQFSDFAVDVAAAARAFDRVERPRPDR